MQGLSINARACALLASLVAMSFPSDEAAAAKMKGDAPATCGRLIILEHMADYAQSPYAGIRYFGNVQRTLGKEKTAEFARLYTAPGVDHVGSGAPANVDMLAVLVDWVENGKAPGDLEVLEQKVEAPAFEIVRALPLCRWPTWPHYKAGPANQAASFYCAP